jgi:hypothetical protein
MGKRPPCQQEGCSKGAIGDTGYCVAHGGGKRCQHEVRKTTSTPRPLRPPPGQPKAELGVVGHRDVQAHGGVGVAPLRPVQAARRPRHQIHAALAVHRSRENGLRQRLLLLARRVLPRPRLPVTLSWNATTQQIA